MPNTQNKGGLIIKAINSNTAFPLLASRKSNWVLNEFYIKTKYSIVIPTKISVTSQRMKLYIVISDVFNKDFVLCFNKENRSVTVYTVGLPEVFFLINLILMLVNNHFKMVCYNLNSHNYLLQYIWRCFIFL